MGQSIVGSSLGARTLEFHGAHLKNWGMPKAYRKTLRVGHVAQVFRDRGVWWLSLLRALRPHQWSKNLLLAVPMALSFQASKGAVWLRVLIAFGAFSLCASAVYLLNDLLDLESDRAHPTKFRRPLACGELSIGTALLTMPVLAGGALLLAAQLSISFCFAILIYVCLTSAYSLHLKQVALVDVLVLAFLYTWRVYAGSIAIEIQTTPWLLAFSVFFILEPSSGEAGRRAGRTSTTPGGLLAGQGLRPR